MDMTLLCTTMSENAKLAAVTAKRNVVPESGGTWLLPRLLAGQGCGIVLPGAHSRRSRKSVNGLVNEVVAPEDLLPIK